MKKLIPGFLVIGIAALIFSCQQASEQPVREDIKTTTMGVVKYGGTYYFSGMTGPDAGGAYPEGMTAQMTNLLEKYKTALAELGLSFDNIIKANVYITDGALKPEMNKVYASYFTGKRPMRVCVVVGLEGAAIVEMDAIAVK